MKTQKIEPTPRFHQGQGAPLLLIHAGWTSWRIWTPILDRLSEKRDVLAPTMLGHLGAPPVSREHPPSLENLIQHIISEMDATGFECPDVVGNSVGGIIALELARMGRVRSVVALCPEGKQSAIHALSLFARGYLSHQLARRLSPVLRQAMRFPTLRKVLMRDASAKGHLLSPELVEHLIEAIAYCDVLQTAKANIKGLFNPPTKNISDVECPVYFIWGAKDSFVSEKEMNHYRADLPDAKYMAIDDCGHCPQLDWPDMITDEILAFTNTVQFAKKT